MTLNDIMQVTNPFRPFRMLTVSGVSYDVRHREAFILTPTYITVGLLPNEATGVAERTVIVDLFHVESVEPLPQTVQAKGNGQAQG